MTTIQSRRGTLFQWNAANPVLASGEVGYETDTGKHKIGDGTSVWSALPYFLDESGLSASMADTSVGRVTSIKHAPALGLYFVEAEGGAPATTAGAAVDCTTALAAARTAAAGKGRVYLNAGFYRANLTITGSGTTIQGAGREVTNLVAASGDILSIQGSHHQIDGLTLKSEIGGGHVVEQTGSIDRLRMTNFRLNQTNSAKSVWDNNGFGFVENVFDKFDLMAPGNSSVNPWYMVSSGGDLNGNQWLRGRATRTGTTSGHGTKKFFYVESTAASSYASDNVWRDLNFEVPVSGCLDLRGALHPDIHITAWDTGAQAAKADHIYIGPGSGGAQSRYADVTFSRRAGSLGGTVLGTLLALSAAADTVMKVAHGLSNGQVITLSTIASATGVRTELDYYVVNAAADTFQLALTAGGSVVDITADGTATVTVDPVYDVRLAGSGGTTSVYHMLRMGEDATGTSAAVHGGGMRFSVLGRLPQIMSGCDSMMCLSARTGVRATSASDEIPLWVRADASQTVNLMRVSGWFGGVELDRFTMDSIGRTTVGAGGPISNATFSVLASSAATIAAIISAASGSSVDCFRVRKSGAVDYFTIGNTGAANFSSTVSAGGKVSTVASAAGSAGLRLPHGVAPTTPADGDVWTTTAGMFVRINGVTKTVTLT